MPNDTVVTDTVVTDDSAVDTTDTVLTSDTDLEVKDDSSLLSTDTEDGDTKDTDSKADEPEGAPEKYLDFTVPETMELNQELLEQALPVFKGLNLTQEQAQELIDLQAGFAEKESQALTDAWENTMTEWVDQSKSDSEFGGKVFTETLVNAKEAISAFGNDGFKSMLETTGVGNHPEMIRFLNKIGKITKEHDILPGGSKGGEQPNQAALMYPSMAS